MRSLLGVCLCLATATAAAHAQEVELRWSFQAGETHVYQKSVRTTMQMPGAEIVQSQIATIRKDVLSTGEDGSAIVELTTDSIRALMSGLAEKHQFDSTAAEPSSHPGAAMLAAMVGVSFGGELITTVEFAVPEAPVYPWAWGAD